jgi:hypothetical protein
MAAASSSGGWTDAAALPAPAAAALLAALFFGGCGGPAAAAAAPLGPAPQALSQPMPARMARAPASAVARLAGGRALPAAPSVVADVADGGLFGLVGGTGGGEEAGAEAEAEVEPFTMYGNNFKKYSIEVLKGDKARPLCFLGGEGRHHHFRN